MAFAQTDDGTRISYETHGSGGLQVILLHGWGGSASYWRDLVRHLNLEGLQVIAPSYRGHGDSDKPAKGYTLDEFAKDVLAVADTAGGQRLLLVGFSMSGKFAQYIAAVHPEHVVGLVLVAPVPASEFPVPAEVAKAWCDTRLIGMPHLTKYSHPSRRFRSNANSPNCFSMTSPRLLGSPWRRH